VKFCDMRAAEKNMMLKTIGAFVVARINAALAAALSPRDKRIVELEKQIAELQNRLTENPAWDYVDQWSENKTYFKNNGVTHQGSAWIVRTASTNARPGSGSADWRLIVKRGRDAKDRVAA